MSDAFFIGLPEPSPMTAEDISGILGVSDTNLHFHGNQNYSARDFMAKYRSKFHSDDKKYDFRGSQVYLTSEVSDEVAGLYRKIANRVNLRLNEGWTSLTADQMDEMSHSGIQYWLETGNIPSDSDDSDEQSVDASDDLDDLFADDDATGDESSPAVPQDDLDSRPIDDLSAAAPAPIQDLASLTSAVAPPLPGESIDQEPKPTEPVSPKFAEPVYREDPIEHTGPRVPLIAQQEEEQGDDERPPMTTSEFSVPTADTDLTEELTPPRPLIAQQEEPEEEPEGTTLDALLDDGAESGIFEGQDTDPDPAPAPAAEEPALTPTPQPAPTPAAPNGFSDVELEIARLKKEQELERLKHEAELDRLRREAERDRLHREAEQMAAERQQQLSQSDTSRPAFTPTPHSSSNAPATGTPMPQYAVEKPPFMDNLSHEDQMRQLHEMQANNLVGLTSQHTIALSNGITTYFTGSRGGIGKTTVSWMAANTLAIACRDFAMSYPDAPRRDVYFIEVDYTNPKIESRLSSHNKNIGNIARTMFHTQGSVTKESMAKMIADNTVEFGETGLKVIPAQYSLSGIGGSNDKKDETNRYTAYAVVQIIDYLRRNTNAHIIMDGGTLTSGNLDRMGTRLAGRLSDRAVVVSWTENIEDTQRSARLIRSAPASKPITDIHIFANQCGDENQFRQFDQSMGEYVVSGWFPKVQSISDAKWVGQASQEDTNAMIARMSHFLKSLGYLEIMEVTDNYAPTPQKVSIFSRLFKGKMSS